ncbi:MAG TPA: hypothetical protein VIQ03_02180 [Gammaproteobacteria bacterium]
MRTINTFLASHLSSLLFLLSLFFCPVTRGDTELIPFTGYRLSGEFEDINTGARIDVDDTNSHGFLINIDEKPGAAYEFLYSRQSSKLRSGIYAPTNVLFDIDIEYFHMGGILLKPLNPHTYGFFGAGVGITHFSPNLSGYASESLLSFSLTGGYKFMLSEHLGLRLGFRAYGTTVDSNTGIFCSNGGCTIRFSGDLFTQFEASAGLAIRF